MIDIVVSEARFLELAKMTETQLKDYYLKFVMENPFWKTMMGLSALESKGQLTPVQILKYLATLTYVLQDVIPKVDESRLDELGLYCEQWGERVVPEERTDDGLELAMKLKEKYVLLLSAAKLTINVSGLDKGMELVNQLLVFLGMLETVTAFTKGITIDQAVANLKGEVPATV